MLNRWLVAGAAPAIEAALASIAPARTGVITVIGDARLARALAARGRAVTLTQVDAKETRKLPSSVTVVDTLNSS